MPLGLAKDSMLNLAELASKTDDEALADDGSRSEDTGGSSYATLAESSDNGDKTSGRSNNDADNDGIDFSISEAIHAPIHSNLPIDEVKDRENASVDSNIDDRLETEDQQPNVQRANTNQYTGFQADYYDFENYASYNFPGDDTFPYNASGNSNKKKNPWWQCIFPWIHSDADDHSETEDLTGNEEGPITSRSAGDDHDTDEISLISSGNDIVFEDGPLQRNHDGTGDVSFVDGSSAIKKGILKFPSRPRDNPNQQNRSNFSNGTSSNRTQQSQRRSLFPAYEPKTTEKKNLTTSFSPMARVVTIESSKDMDDEEKSRIWWQKRDYDEFRKTGRMISKVMLQGGSEIWLATNQSWQLPNQGKAATLRRAMANVDNEDTSDKWWHKFGHSRRGLEHIASIDEGRQRQANVKKSIRETLAEQSRQKAYRREDPEKLRMCSIQNTSWAKDLALASGASDADAVTKNFDDENRKSREFYLLKFSRTGKLNSTANTQRGSKQVVPAFMKPMISMQLRPNRFDANTTSRLKFKKKDENKASTTSSHKRVKSDLPAIKAPNAGDISTKTGQRVPIHDPVENVPGSKSLASKAAGFANGEEAVNMSAVLTGMGPIPKNTDATRSLPVLA